MRQKLVAEFLGTYMLVLSGTGAVVANDLFGGKVTHVGVSLVFGLVVMAMIYAIGETSGSHINPAATVAFWSAGRFEFGMVLPYVISQCLGAIAASATLKLLFADHQGLGGTLPAGPWWQSFVLEILLTFMLMFVALSVSTGAKEKGIMAGAAVGGVVAFEALFAGPISGASMNPARSLGPALVSGNDRYLWLYIVAPIIGAVLAALACRILEPKRPEVVPTSENA